MDDANPKRKWDVETLRSAERTAAEFFEENREQIAETMRAKARFLEMLMRRVAGGGMPLAERLDTLARISEVAELIRSDADGFFELASRPVVARILGTVERRR